MKLSKTRLSMEKLVTDLFEFSSAISRFSFLEGNKTQSYVCSYFGDFPNISELPKIVSLKLFGKLHFQFLVIVFLPFRWKKAIKNMKKFQYIL